MLKHRYYFVCIYLANYEDFVKGSYWGDRVQELLGTGIFAAGICNYLSLLSAFSTFASVHWVNF
jgi:hypothetical protein